MKIRSGFISALIIATVVSSSLFAYGEELKQIDLPAPRMDGGKPLMQALKERQSMRDFSPRELPLDVMSDMLWAACGVNRPASGLRTAPTAHNAQEIDVYVLTSEGTYLYDAKANILIPVLAGDIRGVSGAQPFVKDAPVNLVFVADYAKMGKADAASKELYSATDTGYISQNVYLYCASAGLATVVRGWLDRDALSKAMNLRSDQRIVLTQTVGYPGE